MIYMAHKSMYIHTCTADAIICIYHGYLHYYDHTHTHTYYGWLKPKCSVFIHELTAKPPNRCSGYITVQLLVPVRNHHYTVATTPTHRYSYLHILCTCHGNPFIWTYINNKKRLLLEKTAPRPSQHTQNPGYTRLSYIDTRRP